MIASGILIDKGVIITDRHVVEDYQSVLVRDFDGDIHGARVIPHNIQTDLAVLVRGSNKTLPNIKESSRKLDHKIYTLWRLTKAEMLQGFMSQATLRITQT